MTRRKRLLGLVVLSILIAPGTWLRTEVSRAVPRDFMVEQVAGPSSTDQPGWSVGGVWHYRGEGRFFGGFSAILTLQDETLRAFSDRGVRLTIYEPDAEGRAMRERPVARQLVSAAWMYELWDIESATRDPATGNYWLGYEHHHAIQRFSVASEAEAMRDLNDELDWYRNAGLEAMERLSDGAFFVLGEGQSSAMLYPGDPTAGGEPESFAFDNPAPGFVATDMAELPDGRVMVLMRRVVRSLPPFEALIAIGNAPDPSASWRPEIALRLSGVIPAENYEGLAVRPKVDGTIDVWLIADDNFSILQRTLLAKLVFAPDMGR